MNPRTIVAFLGGMTLTAAVIVLLLHQHWHSEVDRKLQERVAVAEAHGFRVGLADHPMTFKGVKIYDSDLNALVERIEALEEIEDKRKRSASNPPSN